MYRASYVVWKIAHSARLDDATFIAEKSRLIPTYYPNETWTCRAIWTNQELTLPEFSNSKSRLEKENFVVDGQELKAVEQKYFQFTARFNRGGSKVGYRCPMVWNGKHSRVQ